MAHRDSDRAVSEVIGFVLIFSMITMSFVIIQTEMVPSENKRTEFKHNQQVQGQFQELRNAILTNAVSGTDQTVSITLGATYPDRTFFVNWGYSGGGVATVPYDSGNTFTIANATAVDTYGETDDYWNGTNRTFPNKPIVYQPVYTYYQKAPTTWYDNTLAFNRFDNANLTISEQSLVNGKRITLISLVGNLTKSGSDTASIDPEAVSVGTSRVAIRGKNEPINITISTKLPRDKWNETLAEENVSNGGHIKRVKDTGNEQVSIILEAGVTYDLQMAKIGVGNGVKQESAKYLTLNSKPGPTVTNDTSHFIAVEVRDRYNNPVSGFQVNGSVLNHNGALQNTSVMTDSRGVAVFNYTSNVSVAADGSKKAKINLSIYDAKPARNQTWINLTVQSSVNAGGGGSGGSTSEESGSGNSEQWSSSNTGSTISQSGGILQGIGNAQNIYIKNPKFQSIKPHDGGVQTGEEYFRMAFVLEKNVTGQPTGTKRYMFVFPPDKQGITQKIDDASINWPKRTISIYVDENTNNDGTGWVKVVDGKKIKEPEMDDWYQGNGPNDGRINLLDANNYQGGVKQSDLDDIKNFMQNNEVNIYFIDMYGRVDLNVE